jgi:hypothetical protein
VKFEVPLKQGALLQVKLVLFACSLSGDYDIVALTKHAYHHPPGSHHLGHRHPRTHLPWD